jgi:tetratricopeptide (TPR) repeat protein
MELAAYLLRLARVQANIPELQQECLKTYDEFLKIGQADHLLWLEVAQARQQGGKEAEALAARETALNLAPDNINMIMQMQTALRQNKNWTEAAKVLEKGLERLPGEELLLQQLLEVYQTMDDLPGMIKTWQAYAAAFPARPSPRFNLAQCLEKADQLAPAVQALEKACQLDPGAPDYIFALMRLKIKSNHLDEALELAAQLVRQKPRSMPLWQELYNLFAVSRGSDLALLLEKAIQDNERMPPKAFEMRAALALAMDQGQQAALTMEKAAAEFPNNLRVKYLLAGIYEGLNQDDRALAVYGQIMDRDDNFEDAGERYLQVKTRLMQQENARQNQPATP